MSDAQTATTATSATADAGTATQTTATTTAATTTATTAGATTTTQATTTTAAEQPKTWREDWRTALATVNGAVDDKRAKLLERVTSPEGMFQRWFDQQTAIDSGVFRKTTPFPEKGTPDEQAMWRREQGLPTDPKEYKLDGINIADPDKPLVEKFLTRLHGKNASPEIVKEALTTYYELRGEQVKMLEQHDGKNLATAEDTLRQAWPGADYTANMNAVEGFFTRLPESVGSLLKGARLPDGTLAMHKPELVQAFAALEREHFNPMGAIVPNTNDPLRAIEDELMEIKKLMRDDHSEYWRGPKDAEGRTAKERRFLELTNAQMRQGNKRAAA